MHSIEEAITQFLSSTLNLDRQGLTITSDTNLKELLDSLSTLKLIDFLEQSYQIEFGPSDLDADSFVNLRSIDRLVNAKLEQ